MDTGEHTGLRRLIIREPGGTQVYLDSEELEVPVSTANLVATADGTARVMCMVWEDGITYDMTIAVD